MQFVFRPLILCCAALAAAGAALSAAHAQSHAPAGVSVVHSNVVPVQFWSDDQTRRERRAERDRRPGVFRFLFRDDRPPEAAPFAPEWFPEQAAPRQRDASKPRREKRKRPAAPPVPKIIAVEKAVDAKRVLVIGDFLAGALAKGLAAAYVQNANALVIDRSSGSSGLVRSDYHDWTGKLTNLIDEQKPDAILVLIGANDRQPIDTAAGPQALGSDGWRAEYATRVATLADALKGAGKPVLWAGLAPVRSAAMSRDYSTLNGIVREQLEGKALRFVDTWNGFADEDGKFVSVGPDINGQPVQLRNSDGLNFTKAGQRKLAYFVEQQLADLLGGAEADPLALSAAGPAATEPADEGPKIGPMVPLDALVLSNSDALSGGAAQPGAVTASATGDVANAAAVTPAGRADDYKWPIQPPAAPGAPATAPDSAGLPALARPAAVAP